MTSNPCADKSTHLGLVRRERPPLKLRAKAMKPMGRLRERIYVRSRLVERDMGREGLRSQSSVNDRPLVDVFPKSDELGEDRHPPKVR